MPKKEKQISGLYLWKKYITYIICRTLVSVQQQYLSYSWCIQEKQQNISSCSRMQSGIVRLRREAASSINSSCFHGLLTSLVHPNPNSLFSNYQNKGLMLVSAGFIITIWKSSIQCLNFLFRLSLDRKGGASVSAPHSMFLQASYPHMHILWIVKINVSS